MKAPIRNLLLSATLIALPAGGFALAEIYVVPPSASTADAGLGDLSAYKAIVDDAQTIAAAGDLAAAERRITDLETLWDANAAALRKTDRGAWSMVDAAADDAFAALRARHPDPVEVDAALAALTATLDAPTPVRAAQPAQTIAGVAVTDGTGRALPCEDLIGQLRDATAGTAPTADVATLQAKALERCNADDDARADAFAAQALALIKG